MSLCLRLPKNSFLNRVWALQLLQLLYYSHDDVLIRNWLGEDSVILWLKLQWYSFSSLLPNLFPSWNILIIFPRIPNSCWPSSFPSNIQESCRAWSGMTPFHWDKALPKSFPPSVDFVKESSLLRRVIPQQLLLHSPCQCHGGIFSGLPFEELVGFLEVVP